MQGKHFNHCTIALAPQIRARNIQNEPGAFFLLRKHKKGKIVKKRNEPTLMKAGQGA